MYLMGFECFLNVCEYFEGISNVMASSDIISHVKNCSEGSKVFSAQ